MLEKILKNRDGQDTPVSYTIQFTAFYTAVFTHLRKAVEALSFLGGIAGSINDPSQWYISYMCLRQNLGTIEDQHAQPRQYCPPRRNLTAMLSEHGHTSCKGKASNSVGDLPDAANLAIAFTGFGVQQAFAKVTNLIGGSWILTL